jgi:hypothetical protein
VHPLVIPMNLRKSLLKQNEATSSLGHHYSILASGESSLFGGTPRAELADLEVWTDTRFVEEVAQRKVADERRRGTRIIGRFLG